MSECVIECRRCSVVAGHPRDGLEPTQVAIMRVEEAQETDTEHD